MTMATCLECGQEFSLKGWLVKSDLIGTDYEDLIYTMPEEELSEKLREIENTGKIIHNITSNDRCPICNSDNIHVV